MGIERIIDRYDLINKINEYGLKGDLAYIATDVGLGNHSNLSHWVGTGVDALGLYSIVKEVAYAPYADFRALAVDVYTLMYDQKKQESHEKSNLIC